MPAMPDRPGRLYVVATPLGNLEDLSPRALRVLREVALVACEDTRRTGLLLRARQIATPLLSCFEHNERERVPRILERLQAGDDVALVSDAGTPGISDPGYRLVRAARAAGLPVLPVPGPSAVVTALSVAGLPTDRFLFVGFLPARGAARRRAMEPLKALPFTLVFYESPLRLLETLHDLAELLGPRDAFLCREATKLHEEYLPGSLLSLAAGLAERSALKGECVLVVAGADEAQAPQADVAPEELFAQLVATGLTRREAVKQVAQATGLRARDVYRLVLEH
jgi:16S rRNA (cytidine1402-2'-O)-methyltransferase